MTLQQPDDMTTCLVPIEGWAAIYDDVDLNGDMIAPGAFRRSIRMIGPQGVRLLYQHAPEKPIGRWTRFEERTRGLYAYGELIVSTDLGRDTYSLIKARALDGLSIGYQTRRSVRSVKGQPLAGRTARRRIIEANLWEVSIVTFPMAPAARITHLGTPARDTPDTQPTAATMANALRTAGRILSATA